MGNLRQKHNRRRSTATGLFPNRTLFLISVFLFFYATHSLPLLPQRREPLLLKDTPEVQTRHRRLNNDNRLHYSFRYSQHKVFVRREPLLFKNTPEVQTRHRRLNNDNPLHYSFRYSQQQVFVGGTAGARSVKKTMVKKKKNQSQPSTSSKSTRSFTVMLPKGMNIPISGSSSCENDFPNSIATGDYYYCGREKKDLSDSDP